MLTGHSAATSQLGVVCRLPRLSASRGVGSRPADSPRAAAVTGFRRCVANDTLNVQEAVVVSKFALAVLFASGMSIASMAEAQSPKGDARSVATEKAQTSQQPKAAKETKRAKSGKKTKSSGSKKQKQPAR